MIIIRLEGKGLQAAEKSGFVPGTTLQAAEKVQ
jgi:hypothetical protein